MSPLFYIILFFACGVVGAVLANIVWLQVEKWIQKNQKQHSEKIRELHSIAYIKFTTNNCFNMIRVRRERNYIQIQYSFESVIMNEQNILIPGGAVTDNLIKIEVLEVVDTTKL